MFLQTSSQQQSLPSKRWNISPQQQPAHHHCYLQVTLAGGVGNPDTEAPGKKAEPNPTVFEQMGLMMKILLKGAVSGAMMNFHESNRGFSVIFFFYM